MKEPLISIIVPVFNIEKYVPECIESIQKQTYRNMQIILVDDDSSDNSGLLCDRYAAADSRIDVIHKENGGLVSARKIGIKAARGKYIGFVDGDDSIAPEMYQRLVKEIETKKADFVQSGYWEGSIKRAPCETKEIEFPEDKRCFLKSMILDPEKSDISYNIWSKLFRAELLRKSYIRVPDRCSYGEDMINACICVLESTKAVVLDETLYYYRVRSESLSHKNGMDRIVNMFHLYESLCHIIDFYGYAKKDIMNIFLWDMLFQSMFEMCRTDFRMARYYYSDMDKLRGKKVVIYGAGKVGKDYYAQISRCPDCEIAAWIDAEPDQYNYPYSRVDKTDILDATAFDLLLIAVERKDIADEIYDQLTEKGIPSERIFWRKPCKYTSENVCFG